MIETQKITHSSNKAFNSLTNLFPRLVKIQQESLFLSVLESFSTTSFLPTLPSSSAKPVMSPAFPSFACHSGKIEREDDYSIETSSETVGSISAFFESGGKSEAGAVGYDPVGGTSYGIYQISSRQGAMAEFLDYLETVKPEWAKRLKKAGPPDTGSTDGAFPREWRAIAREHPDEFARIQYNFIRQHYFEATCKAVKSKTGVDLKSAPEAIQEAVWSTAVQHGVGGATKIITKALKRSGKKLSGEFLENLYFIRSKMFVSSPRQIQQAVLNRFTMEKEILLGKLSSEKGNIFSKIA